MFTLGGVLMWFLKEKKKLENFDALGLIYYNALPLTSIGEKITNSDVVLICIYTIASLSLCGLNSKRKSKACLWRLMNI